MKKAVVIGGGAALVLPFFASAVGQLENTQDLIDSFGVIVSTLGGILAVLALVVFFWGIVKYIAKAGDEKSKEQGKNMMLGGVIALFVLFSVWGLIRFLREDLGVNQNTAPMPIPQLQ